MAKRFRRGRSGIRAATKTQEKNIVKNAKIIMKDPAIVLPRCMNPGCKGFLGKCYFKNEFDDAKKIRAIQNDEKKLGKYSRKTDLTAAIAGTMLIAHSEKAPYLAAAKLPNVTVTYAKRGEADWEKLVGVQHFTNPRLRLLSVGDKAVKKGLHIYSTEDQMLCTGNKAMPPEEFIQFIKKTLGFGTYWTCKHLNKKNVEEKKAIDKPYIRIEWMSGKKIIGICEECISNNTVTGLKQYFYSPDDEFKVEVISKDLECIKKCEECLIEGSSGGKIITEDYLKGLLTDKQLIERYQKNIINQIKKLEKRIIIMDGKCYGDNIDKFIDALNPTNAERKGLEYIMEGISKPIIIPKSTPNKVLEKFWADYGKKTIKNIVKDDAAVNQIWKKTKIPSEMLEKAVKFSEERIILKNLPQYTQLPPLAEMADKIARGYKVKGDREALKIITELKNDTKEKSLGYSFLLAIGRGKEVDWKYSKVEKDFGEHLKRYAKKLLEAQGQEYHNALQKLISATGSTEKIK